MCPVTGRHLAGVALMIADMNVSARVQSHVCSGFLFAIVQFSSVMVGVTFFRLGWGAACDCCQPLSRRESHPADSIVCYRDGDKMAPAVEKKIAELEMGLLHLQQNIDIPEITLQVHPAVAQVIRRYSVE